MKSEVLDLQGKNAGEVQLPQQFSEEFRSDLIKRAFHAFRSIFLQPKGVFPEAGFQTTAAYYGRRKAWRQIINTGRSRLPREKIPGGSSGRVLRVPQAAKGRRAHPPKPEKKILEKINLKEKNKALRSAISATLSKELVGKRGHKFDGKLPLIVSDEFESLNKVKEVKATLEKLGLSQDLQKSSEHRKLRTGIARLRRGGYRTPKSALLVISKENGVEKAARNLPGIDVAIVDKLNAELLAPGGNAGRLAVWTKAAIERMEKEKLYL